MEKKSTLLHLGALVLVAALVAAIWWIVTPSDDGSLAERPFPALHIVTQDEVPIRSREIWVNAVFALDNTNAADAFDSATGQIRGRGNSSWDLFQGAKLPYRIRFDESRTIAGTDHTARSWVLIANHSDKSLMRNYAAYYFASLLDGMYYAPIAIFVDVYLNGDYRGVYMLSDHQDVRRGRVELTFDADPTISEYHLQFCMRRAGQGGEEGLDFVTINRRHYDIRNPRGDLLTHEHAEYVRAFLTRVEDLARARDERVFNYIHLPSFVDFYIVQELFKNQDVGWSSVFMQIRGQGDDRRLEMGPVWDFDIAAGNAYYQRYSVHTGYHPWGEWTQHVHRWYGYLMRMPAFFDAVYYRWWEIRDDQVVATIDRVRRTGEVNQLGFERNFERWPILGVYTWPNPRRVAEIDTFMGHVDHLANFLTARAAWMDNWFTTYKSVRGSG